MLYSDMRTFYTIALAAVLLTMFGNTASAQRWSISTNMLDYADFLTLNVEGGVSVHRHWSVSVKGRYNPFYFRTDSGGQLQNKTLTVAAGARYWPFFVYSGFYYGTRIQWSRYNSGGIFSPATEEGDAMGLGLMFGYSLIVTKHINIEFGLGLWGGAAVYRKYSSPVCGKRTGSGVKAFIAPNDIHINLMFNF